MKANLSVTSPCDSESVKPSSIAAWLSPVSAPLSGPLYEDEEMTLEVLQAFTLTADHATQERVWNELPEWDRDKPDIDPPHPAQRRDPRHR